MRTKGKGKARDFILEDAYDAWLLSRIIQPGDRVRAKTTRKVLLGKEQVRKTYTLTLSVEDVSFDGDRLVIRGRTVDEHDDIPKGSMHTFRLSSGDWLRVEKADWREADERLRTADAGRRKILLVLFDEKHVTLATFAYGRLKLLARENLQLGGKRDAESLPVAERVRKLVEERAAEYDHILIGGPAFWLEGFPAAWKRIPVTSSHAISWREFLQRADVRDALRGIDAAEEALLLEEVKKRLAQGEKITYTREDVRRALELGAVETLISTPKALRRLTPEEREELLSMARASRSRVHIAEADDELIRLTEKLGGFISLLRYPIS